MYTLKSTPRARADLTALTSAVIVTIPNSSPVPKINNLINLNQATHKNNDKNNGNFVRSLPMHACILTVTHVPHLKEAFQTRIEVNKTQEGSQLSLLI